MENRHNHAVTGKVAAILDERHVAINKGNWNGVGKGMVFAILGSTTHHEIRDPESGDRLGEYVTHVEKCRVKVVKTEDQFAICEQLNATKNGVILREYQVPLNDDSWVVVGDDVLRVFD